MTTDFASLAVSIGGTPRPDPITARAVRTALAAAAEGQGPRTIFRRRLAREAPALHSRIA